MAWIAVGNKLMKKILLSMMLVASWSAIVSAIEVQGYVDSSGRPLRIGDKWYAVAVAGAGPAVPYPQSNYWVGAWHMEISGGGGALYDSSSYTQAATLWGSFIETNLSITSGKTNWVGLLNNTTAYATPGDRPQYTFETNPFSIMAWVNLDSTSGTDYVISKFDPNARAEWRLAFSAGNLYGILSNLGDDGNGEMGRRVTGGWSTGVWTHVAMTWDGGTNYESVHLFRNGVEVDDANFGNGVFSKMNNTLGACYIGWTAAQGAGELFGGYMDAIQIYSNELTAAQLTNIVSQTHPLTNYWAE